MDGRQGQAMHIRSRIVGATRASDGARVGCSVVPTIRSDVGGGVHLLRALRRAQAGERRVPGQAGRQPK
jgi:hypothetical protein